jgi:hypothetical protein
MNHKPKGHFAAHPVGSGMVLFWKKKITYGMEEPGFPGDAAVSSATSIEKLDAKTPGIQAHDFTAALDLAPILGERTRYHDILPHEKLGLALDIGPTGTEILDAALKKLAVGGKIGAFRALRSRVPPRLLILGTPEAPFNDIGIRPYSGIARFGEFFGHEVQP